MSGGDHAQTHYTTKRGYRKRTPFLLPTSAPLSETCAVLSVMRRWGIALELNVDSAIMMSWTHVVVSMSRWWPR